MERNTNLPAKCINEGRPVYFSYARNSSRKPEWEHISDCVELLLETFKNKNIEYRLDKRDIGMGDKISDFEEEIGWKSEVVVIVFSDKYFRSMHCMYEFKQIKNALQQYPEKRLMCIKSGDFNLSDVNYIRELERYWNTQKVEYEDVEYHRLRKHSGTEQAAYENGFYLDDVRELYSFFSAINYSYAQSLDYESFLMDLIKYYAKTPKPKLTPKPEPKANIQPLTPPVTARPPYHANVSYSQQQPQAAPSQSNNSNKMIIGIAAALLLLVGGFWFFNKNSGTDTNSVTNNVADFNQGEDDNAAEDDLNQGKEDKAAEDDLNQGKEDKALLKKAKELYNAGEHSEAVEIYMELANKGNA